ncbi:MAG: sulfatase family protein, partial [Limisphaerales bacterium]
NQMGHVIDIMATCVDLADANYPKQFGNHDIKPMEGVSLVPSFAGKDLQRKNPIFWEHESNRAVRDGKWKLVAKANEPWELYDMETDRTEMHDLASKHPAKLKELAAKWDAWAARANVLPLGGWKDKNAKE